MRKASQRLFQVKPAAKLAAICQILYVKNTVTEKASLLPIIQNDIKSNENADHRLHFVFLPFIRYSRPRSASRVDPNSWSLQ